MEFVIALAAGHWKHNTSKRMPKEIDPNRTLEWVLNMRVAAFLEEEAKHYPDVKIIRVDDLGETRVLVADRAKAANELGADYLLEIHHNSGAKLTKAGGVSIFYYRSSAKGITESVYDAVIAAGGIRGNRSSPINKKGYDILATAKMPATLIECGFMDSTVDGPIILTEEYSRKVARGIMNGIAAEKKLQRLEKAEPADKPVDTTPAEITEGTIVRFKDGATNYRPGGSVIAPWARDYHHVVTQITSNGKPVIKNGVECVLLGKKLEPGKTAQADQLHGINSWVDINVLEIVGALAAPAPLQEGDKVRMAKDAPNAKTGEPFKPWVYDSTLYVRRFEKNDVVLVSTKAEGDEYTGRVHKKYLTKI